MYEIVVKLLFEQLWRNMFSISRHFSSNSMQIQIVGGDRLDIHQSVVNTDLFKVNKGYIRKRFASDVFLVSSLLGLNTFHTFLVSLLLGLNTFHTCLVSLLLGLNTSHTFLVSLLLDLNTSHTFLVSLLLGLNTFRTFLVSLLLGLNTFHTFF